MRGDALSTEDMAAPFQPHALCTGLLIVADRAQVAPLHAQTDAHALVVCTASASATAGSQHGGASWGRCPSSLD